MRLIAAFMVFAMLAGLAFPYLPSGPGDDDDYENTMIIQVDVSCEGAVVTVLDGNGVPLEGAHISVKDTSDATLIDTGDTDAQGVYAFMACGRRVDIKATLDDFPSSLTTVELAPCGSCPECAADADCPDAEYCENGQCVPVQCGCGVVKNHACVEYECCQDSDCPAGDVCESHVCVEKPPQESPGCTEDSDCADDEFCMLSAVAQRGRCEAVSGCGYAVNHTLVPYACGNAPDCPICPEGYACILNECVQGNVSCTGTAFAGAQIDCNATSDGKPCVGCDYVVTGPDGKNTSGTTGDDGTFALPLGKPGEYRVSLLRNGTILRSIAIAAFARPDGGEGSDTALFGQGALTIALLLALLLLLAFAVFYWRGMKGGRKRRKG